MLSRVKCVIFSSIGPDGVRHCRCLWFDSGLYNEQADS